MNMNPVVNAQDRRNAFISMKHVSPATNSAVIRSKAIQSCTTSSFIGLKATSAALFLSATSNLLSLVSTAIILAGPNSRAVSMAHMPTGPAPNTTTVSLKVYPGLFNIFPALLIKQFRTSFQALGGLS